MRTKFISVVISYRMRYEKKFFWRKIFTCEVDHTLGLYNFLGDFPLFKYLSLLGLKPQVRTLPLPLRSRILCAKFVEMCPRYKCRLRNRTVLRSFLPPHTLYSKIMNVTLHEKPWGGGRLRTSHLASGVRHWGKPLYDLPKPLCCLPLNTIRLLFELAEDLEYGRLTIASFHANLERLIEIEEDIETLYKKATVARLMPCHCRVT